MANFSRRAAIKAINGAAPTTCLPLNGVTAQDAITTTPRGRPTTADIDLQAASQEELLAAYQETVLEKFQGFEDERTKFSDQPATRAPGGSRPSLTLSWRSKISYCKTRLAQAR